MYPSLGCGLWCIFQLAITVDGKVYSFTTLEADTEEVNHMITHIGVSLKHIFPAFPLEYVMIFFSYFHFLLQCISREQLMSNN